MNKLSERIAKALLCIAIIPVIWILLALIGVLMIFLPVLAFMFPEKVKVCENNSCVSIFSNNKEEVNE